MRNAREYAHAEGGWSYGAGRGDCSALEHTDDCDDATDAIRAAQIGALRFAMDCAAERFAGMVDVEDKLRELLESSSSTWPAKSAR
jgi:hypothetical protein